MAWLKSELGEKDKIIESLTAANKALREQLRDLGKEREGRRPELNLSADPQSRGGQTEWIFDVPAGRRKIVIEVGANNGEWMAQFMDEHEGFWPVIVEPQPAFSDSLRGLAREYGGMFVQAAAWVTEGEELIFHAHVDQRGVGSSLFPDSVYSNGHCQGRLDCPHQLGYQYSVMTIDLAALIQRIALPQDYIVLRMDIEGAEYAVARRLVTAGVACWLDEWEMEVHAMYAGQNHKFRPVDSVFPWLVRDCGVKMTVFQHYHLDDKLKQLRREEETTDPCAGARYDNDDGCVGLGKCSGIAEE